MSKARLVITAVEIEGITQAEAARRYGVSKGWVSKLVARYRAEPVVASLVSPRKGSEPFPDVKPINFVDRHVLDKLRRLNIHPADLCDDATFLRRVSFDVIGTPPTPSRWTPPS